jgi:hypothetical protein
MSQYFGWSIWSFSVSTNIWATALIFIRAWCVRLWSCYDLVDVTRVFQAAQTLLAIATGRGDRCDQHGESAHFLGRIGRILSVHLGGYSLSILFHDSGWMS